jgi:hypothetical protein
MLECFKILLVTSGKPSGKKIVFSYLNHISAYEKLNTLNFFENAFGLCCDSFGFFGRTFNDSWSSKIDSWSSQKDSWSSQKDSWSSKKDSWISKKDSWISKMVSLSSKNLFGTQKWILGTPKNDSLNFKMVFVEFPKRFLELKMDSWNSKNCPLNFKIGSFKSKIIL